LQIEHLSKPKESPKSHQLADPVPAINPELSKLQTTVRLLLASFAAKDARLLKEQEQHAIHNQKLKRSLNFTNSSFDALKARI
jgi:hypothetical protein